VGELTGQVALLTGGAGRFGRAVALLLAEAGADIAVADMVSPDDAGGLIAEIEARGRRGIYIRTDVTSARDCERMAATTVAELGAIDILIANAGLGGRACAVWEASEDQWDLVLDVSLKGAWLTTKYVVPHMIERRKGKIIMTSSRNGLRAEARWGPYVAAKHGLIGLMKTLAIELGPYRINVNAVCPSSMGWAADHDTWWDEVTGTENVSLEEFNRWSGSQDLFEKDERMPVEAVAEGVLWLVSERARTVTGHALPLDDGWIVKRGG
jgi:NAD(P)-dependent dehydrogenase (short-subunit alcohol dehydrogenase family)